MRADQGFFGGGRYEVVGTLGSGGMGVVYEVVDRRRGVHVALKTLRRPDPASIYRFKREFRAVANASHRNLVALYELVAEPDECFFTMELVRGVDFLRWVGRGTSAGAQATPVGPAMAAGAPPAGDVAGDPPGPLDEARLRDALGQLALGIAALHEIGCLHRDIKPGNVLVTAEGRVVILDMGLVTWVDPADASVERGVAGTAAYMAPEQGMGRPLTPACDWYSTGVMLYEALAGIRPFRGSFEEVIRLKQVRRPRSPGSLRDGVPEDLDSLAMDLLGIEPDRRPTGAEVIERLARGRAPGRIGRSGPTPPTGSRLTQSTPGLDLPVSAWPRSNAADGCPFVGRTEPLRKLHLAWRAVLQGQARTVHLHGASGVGKTALVRRFLADVAGGRDDVVVLSSRCFERESLPFKGVDGLVDSLSRRLRSLPQDRVEALLPTGIEDLCHVFPVLRHVEAIADAAGPRAPAVEPGDVRRRAARCLRDLLASVGSRWPLVLAVDDLQWGDTDSALLLAELVRRPTPPSMMLLASYRGDEVPGSPHLQAFRSAQGLAALQPGDGQGGDAIDLALGPLPEDEASCLARLLLGEGASDLEAQELAREARGNPCFVKELVRWVRQEDGEVTPGEPRRPERGQPPKGEEGRRGCRDSSAPRLDGVLGAHLESLPDGERAIMETVSVAGRPLPRPVLALAADVGQAEQLAIDRLRAARLLRVRVVGGEETLEPYHDRVRQGVMAALPAALLRERHLRLALALAAVARADSEVVAAHFCGAGRLDQAGEHAVLAAGRAEEEGAFGRAATLLRFAVRVLDAGDVARRGLMPRLADALARAGRSSEAAALFARCAAEVDEAAALPLRARAAWHELRSGRLEDGMETLASVLGEPGRGLPSTTAATVRSLAAHRLRLRARGLSWRERSPDSVAPADRARLHACWAASSSLASVDPIRGADCQARGLLLALASGDPREVARFLASEAVYRCASGSGGRRRGARLLAEAATLADRLGDQRLRGLVECAAAAFAYEGGEWARAREMAETAEATLGQHDHDDCALAGLASARRCLLLSLLQLGDLARLSALAPSSVADAEARGDRLAGTALGGGRMNITFLLAGEPARARKALASAAGTGKPHIFPVQRYEALHAAVTIDLYGGAGGGAWRRLQRDWPDLLAARALWDQQTRLEALFLRGRAALCAAEGAPGTDAEAAGDPDRPAGPLPSRRVLLVEATRAARAMLRERTAWSDPLARLLLAGVAVQKGRKAQAIGLLEALIPDLDLRDMNLHAWAARRRLGLLRGGLDGARTARQADGWFARQGVRDPAAITAVFAPALAG